MSSDAMEERQRALIMRARKGLLKHLAAKGGKLSLGELHDYSLNTFFIQHQAFSRLMEFLVDGGYINFDQVSREAELTPRGHSFLSEET